MNIGTWNIEGKRNKEQEMMNEMNDRNIGIAVLTKENGMRKKQTTINTIIAEPTKRAKADVFIVEKK